MKSIWIFAAAVLAAAACSHAQPPPSASAQPAVEAAPPPAPPVPAVAEEPAPAPRTVEVEIVATSVYFDFDSSELSPETRTTLQTFFELARQRPDKDLRIEGNCDERGTREYNLALGQRRADAAKSYLVNLGLDASRITAISFGKERPRALGDDEAAWRQNRRDDLMAATEAVSQASR
jgi:peptidoglycan-associated lipoprotein